MYSITHLLRITIFSIVPAILCSCASQITTYQPEPKVIYNSGAPIPTKITLQQTLYRERVFTPEGLKSSTRAVDYQYTLTMPDNTTTELSFLNAKNDPDRKAAIDIVFYNDANACWVTGTMHPDTKLVHREGGNLLQYVSVNEQFYKATVKVFTKDRLLHESTIEVCSPSENANVYSKAIMFYDRSIPAYGYCGRNGKTVYFPLTNTSKVIDANQCCPEKGAGWYYRDDKASYFKEGHISIPD
ncbi:hypothetical protein [Andreprevotia chitinilytica]|uniref:hypothetical protein n=1 Tax=Andreprevotia chitinilytica TaxID=396808 RepID=UPI000553CAAB|nr:hypothetical protein [Andreprevotia chitinilytica]